MDVLVIHLLPQVHHPILSPRIPAKISVSLRLPPLADDSSLISNKTNLLRSSLMVSSVERSLNVSSCSITPKKVGDEQKSSFPFLNKTCYAYSTTMRLRTIIHSLKKIQKVVERGFVCVICYDNLWIVFLRYFSKTVFEVIFGGRNTSSTAFKPSILG